MAATDPDIIAEECGPGHIEDHGDPSTWRYLGKKQVPATETGRSQARRRFTRSSWTRMGSRSSGTTGSIPTAHSMAESRVSRHNQSRRPGQLGGRTMRPSKIQETGKDRLAVEGRLPEAGALSARRGSRRHDGRARTARAKRGPTHRSTAVHLPPGQHPYDPVKKDIDPVGLALDRVQTFLVWIDEHRATFEKGETPRGGRGGGIEQPARLNLAGNNLSPAIVRVAPCGLYHRSW